MPRVSVVLLLVALGASITAQITQIGAPQLISPIALNFDSAPVGLISSNDPYFLAFGLDSVDIINGPGLHTAGSTTLSSGVAGNCLGSNGNALAIVAPGGPLDDHQFGAGWRFRLAAGTYATQFGFAIPSQGNHFVAVQTWCRGEGRHGLISWIPGGFPSAHIFFEASEGFDEVHIQSSLVATVSPGFGVDDFTLGNLQIGNCPVCEWEGNTVEAAHTFAGISGSCNSVLSLSYLGGISIAISSLQSNVPGAHFEQVFAAGVAIPRGSQVSSGKTALQTVNLDISATLFFIGGALAGTPSQFSPQPLPPMGLTMWMPVPAVAVPLVMTHQSIIFDPAAPEGFHLTQATQLTIL